MGTAHSFQRGDRRKEDFQSFLTDLCSRENINSIAEEINGDAKVIVARHVGVELNVCHLLIDPHPSEYQNLGVKCYHKIVYEVMCTYDLDAAPSDENNTPSEASTTFRSRIALEHNHPRECEWLKRIQNSDIWPVLIICGADHFESFSTLLLDNGINVKKSYSNWGS